MDCALVYGFCGTYMGVFLPEVSTAPVLLDRLNADFSHVRTYTRESTSAGNPDFVKMDFRDKDYPAKIWLYIVCGKQFPAVPSAPSHIFQRHARCHVADGSILDDGMWFVLPSLKV
jgi:hypothetical protein